MRAESGERLDHLLDLLGADVQMSDQTQARRRTDDDPAFGHKGLDLPGTLAELYVDHVGLHRLDAVAQPGQRLGLAVAA